MTGIRVLLEGLWDRFIPPADYIEDRMERCANRLEVDPSGVNVRPLGSRWGSCSPDGTLNLHWRSILLPARLVNYVVVHEMVHLHEPHHDDAFWARVERAMPDYERHKRERAEEGACTFRAPCHLRRLAPAV